MESKSIEKYTKLANKYIIGDQLGVGGYGIVYAGINIKTDAKVAIKQYIHEDDKEIAIHKHLKKALKGISKTHKEAYIVKMITSFKQDKIEYGVFDLYSQDLSQAIFINDFVFSIEQIMKISYQILIGVDVLHDLNITHKDLKLENIMIEQQSENFELLDIRIIDLGCMVIEHNKGYDYVGTVVNSAPEALNNNVEKTPNKIDIWSLGCLIFKLCTREQIAPYDIMNDQELLGNYYKELPQDDIFETIQESLFELMEWTDRDLMKDLVDLLKNMLQINPDQRYDAKQALGHKFFNLIKQQPDEESKEVYSCQKKKPKSKQQGKEMSKFELMLRQCFKIKNIAQLKDVKFRKKCLKCICFIQSKENGLITHLKDKHQLTDDDLKEHF